MSCSVMCDICMEFFDWIEPDSDDKLICEKCRQNLLDYQDLMRRAH